MGEAVLVQPCCMIHAKVCYNTLPHHITWHAVQTCGDYNCMAVCLTVLPRTVKHLCSALLGHQTTLCMLSSNPPSGRRTWVWCRHCQRALRPAIMTGCKRIGQNVQGMLTISWVLFANSLQAYLASQSCHLLFICFASTYTDALTESFQ